MNIYAKYFEDQLKRERESEDKKDELFWKKLENTIVAAIRRPRQT